MSEKKKDVYGFESADEFMKEYTQQLFDSQSLK